MDTTAHAHVGHEHGEKQGKGKPFGPDAWLALTTVSLLNTENRRGGLVKCRLIYNVLSHFVDAAWILAQWDGKGRCSALL